MRDKARSAAYISKMINLDKSDTFLNVRANTRPDLRYRLCAPARRSINGNTREYLFDGSYGRPLESAKSHLFDTSRWHSFCDVTLTLKQARQSEKGAWIKIDDYPCRQAFRHFMNLLNRTVYGAAYRRYGKRLRVLPVLEKGEVRASALRSWERGTSGRWHIHCAIELPTHVDAIALEKLIRHCWAKVELGYGRILIRDCANAGWINYMLKDRQKSKFDGFLDCIMIESLHNPIVDA
jgi:hypothetical protein